MNTQYHARSPYARPLAPVRTPRSLEYDLLALVTQRLKTGWANRKQDYPAFATAITENLAVWSTLAADVANPNNGLPGPLRAQLFYLFEFSDLHSRKVLEGDGSVEVLVDINTAVMRGLRGDTGAEA